MNGQLIAILKLIILLLIILLSPSTKATVIFSEAFETNGNGIRYITSTAEFSDGGTDYFTRTNGSNISANIEYIDSDGYYFAAQDIDSEFPFLDRLELSFFNINIANYTNLLFSVSAAEDDDRNHQDWDSDTSVLFEYRIDGGAYQPLLAFAAFGGTNTEPGLDTDFDGIADDRKLTNRFTRFSNRLLELGNVLDIKVNFDNLDAGDEDIAIDSLMLFGEQNSENVTLVSEPSVLLLLCFLLTLLYRRV